MNNEQDEVYTGNNCNYPWQPIPRNFLTQQPQGTQEN